MCMFEHLADMAAALPVPTPNPNITWLERAIYLLHHTTSQTFLVSSIVILKQFIIKYEHFVQGQLHFTKKNHTTKIAGVWFTTWIMVWNHVYISLKFTKKKRKENQFWASCCTAEVLWCNHSHPCHIPFLKLRLDAKRFNKVELHSPLEVKVNSTARWAVLPHIISWCWVSVIIFVRIQSIVNSFNYIPLACQFTSWWEAGDVLTC